MKLVRSCLTAICALAVFALGCDETTEVEPTPTTTSDGGGGAAPGGMGGSGASSGGGGAGGDGGAGGAGGDYPCDEPPTTGNSAKVDLLVVVDNSRSMADKQQLLAAGMPELVRHLVNPRCLDANGIEVANQPTGPADDCPPSSEREYAPVTDLHIGVISSSIGGHGSDACTADTEPSEDDAAHLLDRSDTDGGPLVPTYDDKGFLVWDPAEALSPPGTCSAAELGDLLGTIVTGAGEVGCGFEASLESWYRFLVDPDPYDNITIDNSTAQLNGTDATLLQQRADFLRPDSVVMILMISDENDCSTRDGGQYFYANQIYQPSSSTPYHLPKPRAACATDPNDPCCRSCGQSAGGGCDTSNDDCSGALPALDDHIALRCFEQKRRFGIDFLWPIDRYVSGLSDAQVADRHGNVVANPLAARGASMVYLAGIVGVPWHDIARRTSGTPDLLAGNDANSQPVGGLQTAAELTSNGTWDVIVGDVPGYVNATDPLMVESIDPRSGSNPITSDAIEPPTAGLMANPINGHEYSIADRGDLQYACIFPLETPRDCTSYSGGCDCTDPSNDNPLCQAPNGQFGTTQYYAKAYPSRRELQVIKDIGAQGVVGSICAAQIGDSSAADYGYRPTFKAIAETLRSSLTQ